MENKIMENPIVTPRINIGSLLDIPTGAYVKGNKDETLLNGGLTGMVLIAGMPDNFKSTILHYMMLQAGNRIKASIKIPDGITLMHTYDTEDTMLGNIHRIMEIASNFDYLPHPDFFSSIGWPYDTSIWSLATKSTTLGEEWVKWFVEMGEDKISDKNKYVRYNAFKDTMRKKDYIEAPIPTFVEIDSLSILETSSTAKAVLKKSIEELQTINMQRGLIKHNFIKILPRYAVLGNTNILMTSHLGEKIDINTLPFSPKPRKKLVYLKQNDTIKGIPDALLYSVHIAWLAHDAKPLKNTTTKQAEYPPEYSLPDRELETELNVVNLTSLRSKIGPAGFTIQLLVSQREGVLPSLTEFHFIKTNNFGITGNKRQYHLDLYPDITITRTTIRKLLKQDKKLERAINITSELLQLITFMPGLRSYLMEPKELYEKIKERGYDWNEILQTRGWWTIDNYSSSLPNYLSTLDLLRMAKGEYEPFWLKNKKGKK